MLKSILRFILTIALSATSAYAGTITGNIQTPSGGALVGGTLTFTLSQAAILSGSASIVPSAVSCYTSTSGAIVGLPDPTALPVISANLGAGTLASGTYYVKITYYNGSGESLASPESSFFLSGTGTLIVSAPVSQPASATGYKVYISSATGTETLQATQASWTNYNQASALSAGSALPSSNSSTCSIKFSDELIPSGTNYQVNLLNKNGAQMSGYPQTWYTFGGSGGTINVSNGTPQGGGAVIYPTPILALPLSGAPQSISGDLSIGTNKFTAGTIEGVQYADVNTSIQAAMNKCSAPGCRVKVSISGSPYTITSALNPPFSGVNLECDNSGVSNFGTIGTVIRTTGAIWAFQNPTPTANVLNHVGISNCVFDLSQNSSALGGLNLRAISYSKLDNVSVILPAAGAMEGFRFDAQDAGIGGYWNECFHCTVVSSGTGLTNTHIGFRWINGANDDNLFGGQVYGVNTAFKVESADHVTVLGTAGEATSSCLWLAGTGNSVNNNNLQPGRCESVLTGAQAVIISAGSYNNHIVVTPVGYADAAHDLSDLSLGHNWIDLDSANGGVHTFGDLNNTAKFGFNMTGTQTGIEVNGVVASTRATGNTSYFKGASGTQAFFAGAFDTYGAAQVGTSSSDPLAFFTSNTERARFAASGAFSLAVSLGFTNLLASATAPTISSGFGTSPSVASNNGTAAFSINVGTGGTATNGVIGLPTAANGWVCRADDLTTQSATVFVTRQIASTTTTATIANFNTSGAQAAWVASDILSVSCLAR